MLRPFLSILLLGAAMAAADSAREISPMELQARLREVAANVMPSCVAIRASSPARWSSGVLIDREKGWIAASLHGVKAAGNLQVWFPADLEPREARLVKADASQDVAILAIGTAALPPAIPLQTAPLAAGEWVVAIGYPGGLEAHAEPSLRLGRVADADQWVTTCRLCAGDSGGPLLTLDGRLAGIHRKADEAFTTHVPVSILKTLGL